ncbi:hypothetical protein HN937_20345, partial [Candidatus Poribacteria bacterium]|nr:hypothetical protein [Candidatus Poribacteria bacterium]
MPISDDARFEFDVQGYIHLRGALTAGELVDYGRWIAGVESVDTSALNADDAERVQY